ncbi:MAG: RNA methyltransferase [Candidatus Micrarchaeaceae archaeon]
MEGIEVAIMEPKYQINLGYIARVSKNFGVRKLLLINPRCNHLGKEAIKYSKHARDLLEGARICRGMSSMNKGLIIGTTGIWHKTGNAFYNLYRLDDVGRMARRAQSMGKKVTILLGRDDTGLSKEELRHCDATISLETDANYPILNISHALAIILHAMKAAKAARRMETPPDAAYQNRLFSLFKMMVGSNKRIRDKQSVNMAFAHVVRRAMPTRKEINALSIAIAPQEKMKTAGQKIKAKA